MDNGQLDDILKNKLEDIQGDHSDLHWDALWQKMQLDPDLAEASDIDAFFKSALTDLSGTEVDAGAWEAFQEKRRLSEAEEIDEIFRDKLTDVEGLPELGVWAAMAARMEAEVDGRTAEEQAFDQALQEKIDLVTPLYAAATWDALQEKMILDDELMADSELDEAIQDSLEQFSQPFNPSHWEIMRERLLEQQSILYQLYQYKVAELSLLLLTIFTVINFWPQINGFFPATKEKVDIPTEQTIIADVDRLEDQNIGETEQDQMGLISVDGDRTSYTTPEITTVAKPSTRGDLHNLPRLTKSSIGSHSETILKEKEERSASDEDIQGASSRMTFAASELQKIPVLPLVAIATSERQDIPEQQFFPKSTLGTDFNFIDTKPVFAETSLSEDYKSAMQPDRNKSTFQIGMFGNYDVNYVMTPYDEEFDQEAYSQLTPGYGGGLSVGIGYNRWGFETGLVYASQYYEPILNIEVDQGSLFNNVAFAGRGLQSARINLLNIPVQVSYNLTPDRKWEWYSIAGASMRVMMETHYNFRTFALGGPPPAAFPGGRNLTPDPSLQQQHEESAHIGILDGGDFFRNKYFALNLGFGLERHLNNRWGIFVQPIYQHQLSRGRGPNRDVINSISISTGLKVNL